MAVVRYVGRNEGLELGVSEGFVDEGITEG